MKKSGKFKDIYSFMPRFVTGDEIEYENGVYLSPIVRRFEWNHTEFKLVISPALINGHPNGGKHYFPGKRERIVESALIELADPENRNFHEKEAALVVRLNFLFEVISDMSTDMQLSVADIELALHVLAHAKYELTFRASGFKFHPIELLHCAERNGEVYYYAKLASLAPSSSAVFDCLFADKSLSELGEKFEFTF